MFRSLFPSVAALTTRKGAGAAVAVVLASGALLSVAGFGTTGSPVFVTPASAQSTPPAVDVAKSFNGEQRKAIEQIIREYLVAHPELLLEVTKELETRQQAQLAASQQKLIVEKKGTIFRASTDFVLGNPNGSVSVVEFFDYNCGWCKRAVDELGKLTKADPNVRVVLKELPIFGENSTFAAKAAMASLAQGKYWEYHTALMREKQVTKDVALKVAERVGLDVARLKRDMDNPAFDAALKANHELAQALGIEGTPGFIVDTKVNVGYVPAEGLKDLIAEVRKTGCQVC